MSLNSPTSNPFVFVIGCQRSGTTMLQRMLDAHPSLAVAYDSLFIPRVIMDQPIGMDPPLTDELIARVNAHPRFKRLELPAESIEAARHGAQTYSQFVSGLYREYARLRDKPLAGEKSPGYCRHIPRLFALFPRVKFIHLIRDGREVALSIRDWGKGAAKLDMHGEEPIAVGALWWRRDIRLGRQNGQELGAEHYREVRYDALVDQPEKELRGITEFLGLPFQSQMLEYHKGKQRAKDGLSAKAAWLPPTKGLRNWRNDLSLRDQQVFEAIAGDELESLGFERLHSFIPNEAREVANRCQDWWLEAKVGSSSSV